MNEILPMGGGGLSFEVDGLKQPVFLNECFSHLRLFIEDLFKWYALRG